MYPKEYFKHTQDTQAGYCFVLMPFAQQFREVYDVITEALSDPAVQYYCRRADDFFGGGHIIEDILYNIATAEFVIADVTSKNPNVFYELGIVHTVKDVEKVIIITQSMDDVPFDLRQFRCLPYEQSQNGLMRLKAQLRDSFRQREEVIRFSIREKASYKSTERFLGADRCLYDFEISQLMSGRNSAKYILSVNKYSVGNPIQLVYHESHGGMSGFTVTIPNTSYILMLERVENNTAYFRVFEGNIQT
jgi:hypothetical protein